MNWPIVLRDKGVKNLPLKTVIWHMKIHTQWMCRIYIKTKQAR